MPVETGKRIMECALLLCKAVKKGLKPDGLNLIQSNKVAGGQTIDHFHLHIVPRYKDDEVILKFGHGSQPEGKKILSDTAAAIKKAL
jgi:histidine triad (HIT) family protein